MYLTINQELIFFNLWLNTVKNQGGALYIIKTLVLYIIRFEKTVYHQADSFLYTPKGVMIYAELCSAMIYTRTA